MTPEEQYKVCAKQFDGINAKLDKIYNKLFEDNGAPCLQTKVDRNTRWIKTVSWAIGIIYAAAMGTIAWLFKK